MNSYVSGVAAAGRTPFADAYASPVSRARVSKAAGDEDAAPDQGAPGAPGPPPAAAAPARPSSPGDPSGRAGSRLDLFA